MEANLLLFKTVIAGDSHLTFSSSTPKKRMIFRGHKKWFLKVSELGFFETSAFKCSQVDPLDPLASDVFSPPDSSRSARLLTGSARAGPKNTLYTMSRFWVTGPLTWTNMIHEPLRHMSVFRSGFYTSLSQIIRIRFFHHFYNSIFTQSLAWDRMILFSFVFFPTWYVPLTWTLRLGWVGRTHHHAAPSNGHHFYRVSAHNCVAGTEWDGFLITVADTQILILYPFCVPFLSNQV